MKRNNITDYADRKIFARQQANSVEATYLFECENRKNLEAVNFLLRGGMITDRFLVPRDLFTMSNTIYNGSAVPDPLAQGPIFNRGR